MLYLKARGRLSKYYLHILALVYSKIIAIMKNLSKLIILLQNHFVDGASQRERFLEIKLVSL